MAWPPKIGFADSVLFRGEDRREHHNASWFTSSGKYARELMRIARKSVDGDKDRRLGSTAIGNVK